MKPFEQNLNWLHEETNINHSTKLFLLVGPIAFAKIYFEKWTDNKIKECWHELDKIITLFIERFGKETFLDNPISVILNHTLLKSNLSTEYNTFFE